MEVPSKIKKFLWKVCSVAIPCCFELWRRKIKDSPKCPICCKEQEIIEHLLFFCEWTRGIWFIACSSLKIEREGMTRFDAWLVKVMEG